MLTQPTWALAMFAGLASLAGFVVGGLLSRAGEAIDKAVRLGGKSAVVATLVASASFALMARKLPGDFSAIRGFLIPLVCALPVILVGSMAAALGALTCRCAEGSDENRVAPAVIEPPRYFKFCYWGIVFAAILVTVLCPFYPTPYPQAEKRADTAPFHYSAPEAMAKAPVAAWKLETQRVIGNFDINRGLDISKDERFVAGVNGGDIVVYDLESEQMQKISNLPFSVGNLSFNPRGDRLFLVSGSEPRRIAVVELMSRRVFLLPQPKKHAVPSGRVVWWDSKEVIFHNDGKTLLTLNLDSLEIDPSNLSPPEVEEIRLIPSQGWPRNERWALGRSQMVTSSELPETEGITDWLPLGKTVLSFSDLQHPMERCLPEIDVASDDLIIGASNGSKILRVRNGEATAFYFGMRPVPPLRWSISMPHGPEKLLPADSAKYARELGELFLMLYAPMTNPLTGKTIGPDRSQPKAVLRVLKWEGIEAEVSINQDYHPFAKGDVFADVYRTVRRSSPLLLKFEGPHRWWMLAPEPPVDSDDLAKLPTKEDLEKRWRAATDKIVEEEKKADAVKASEVARLAAEKQMSKPPIVLVKPDSPAPIPPVENPSQIPSQPRQSTPLEKEITRFVVEHHEKASGRDITAMVQDYAQRVDHFTNGIVDRMFIYTDEFKYRQKLANVTEEVDGPVVVRDLGNGKFEARYIMSNFIRFKDGRSERGRFQIIFEIEKQGGVWQIIKHRSAPEK